MTTQCRHCGQCFAEWKTSFELFPTVFNTSLIPLLENALSRGNKVQSKQNGSSYYQLSSLILRHCQADTDFSDDATPPKDDAPWRWNRGKRSFSLARRTKTRKKRIKQKMRTTCLLHNIPVFNSDDNTSYADTRMAPRSPCRTQSTSRIALRNNPS